MAEGLEEESKKSLRMEAELENQLHMYEAERKTLKAGLNAIEHRYKIFFCLLQWGGISFILFEMN